MSSQFETTIAALWRAIGMPPPRFTGDARIVLQLDGAPIALRETPDAEHVLVSATAGALAPEDHRSADQVNELLRANLANAARFSACVTIEEREGATPQVVVQGLYAYRERNIEKLAAQIQEVAHLRGDHSARLSGDVRPANSLSYLAEADAEATIFRP
jgi:hypothetical protein